MILSLARYPIPHFAAAGLFQSSAASVQTGTTLASMTGVELSCWFFAGVQFLVFGLIAFVTDVWELSHPPAHPSVLNSPHPAVWWAPS
jgi:hypothetical protein